MPLNDPEVKAAWLAKLRSGEIEQARGQLETPDGAMCCLGILMTVQDMKPSAFYKLNKNGPRWDEALNTDIVPYTYRQGLTIEEMWDLARRNDGDGANYAGDPDPIPPQSFAQIADHIEANL